MTSPFNYPFDLSTIFTKKKSLKRQLLETAGPWMEKKIAILGGSTTADVRNLLELFLLDIGIKPIFYESEYNRFYEDGVFGNAALDEFSPDVIYIHTTSLNITAFPDLQDSAETVNGRLRNEFDRYLQVWTQLRQRFSAAIIQNNFDRPLCSLLSNLDAVDERGRSRFIERLNEMFSAHATQMPNFYIHDIHGLSAQIGLERWHDPSAWFAYKYALALDAIPTLAHSVAHLIGAIYGRSKKVLVLDLDNTLWGGVIGDDGENHIHIGRETPLAEAYSAFQHYVKALKQQGILLALCSKNDLAIAKKGLEHPDSILRWDDFSAARINWEAKHLNIVEIATELQVGLDSLVFIDDNPVERDLVRSQLPMVAVPDVGDDVTQFPRIIDRNRYFESAALSTDDLQRSSFYRNNQERALAAEQFQNYDDFLRSLEMKAAIQPFDKLHLDRITQLTNKTNQFNLTTRRYTYAEIETISLDPRFITLYGRLIDRFGDNGLVSVIIGQIHENELTIDLWLMSCRVLKRTMEQAMFERLLMQCRHRGIQKIIGLYRQTAKNGMVANLYSSFGFMPIGTPSNGDSLWQFHIPTPLPAPQSLIHVNEMEPLKT